MFSPQQAPNARFKTFKTVAVVAALMQQAKECIADHGSTSIRATRLERAPFSTASITGRDTGG